MPQCHNFVSGISPFCLQSQNEKLMRKKVVEIVNKVQRYQTQNCGIVTFSLNIRVIYELKILRTYDSESGRSQKAGNFNLFFSYYWRSKYGHQPKCHSKTNGPTASPGVLKCNFKLVVGFSPVVHWWCMVACFSPLQNKYYQNSNVDLI